MEKQFADLVAFQEDRVVRKLNVRDSIVFIYLFGFENRKRDFVRLATGRNRVGGKTREEIPLTQAEFEMLDEWRVHLLVFDMSGNVAFVRLVEPDTLFARTQSTANLLGAAAKVTASWLADVCGNEAGGDSSHLRVRYLAIRRAVNGHEWGREWDAGRGVLGEEQPWEGWPAFWGPIGSRQSPVGKQLASEHMLRFHALLLALKCLITDTAHTHYLIEGKELHAANLVDDLLDRQYHQDVNPTACGLTLLSDEMRNAFNIKNLTTQQKELLDASAAEDGRAKRWMLVTGGPGTGKTLLMQVYSLHASSLLDSLPTAFASHTHSLRQKHVMLKRGLLDSVMFEGISGPLFNVALHCTRCGQPDPTSRIAPFCCSLNRHLTGLNRDQSLAS